MTEHWSDAYPLPPTTVLSNQPILHDMARWIMRQHKTEDDFVEYLRDTHYDAHHGWPLALVLKSQRRTDANPA